MNRSWPPRAGHAGNALQIGDEFDLLEAGAGEQFRDCGRLAVADFENQKAAGNERIEGGGNEAAVDSRPSSPANRASAGS